MRSKPFTEFPAHLPSINIPNWLLVIAFIAYALPGNIGHVPWRGDDALHIGVTYSMLKSGAFLTPQIASAGYLEWPPLLYWIGMLCSALFGWLLPLADAIRMGGVLALAVLVLALHYTARELYGRESASAATLLTLGSLGLLIHAHEMQPQVLAAACIATTLCGLVQMPAFPRRGGLIAGIGTGMAFLASGLSGLVLCLPLWLTMPLCSRACHTKDFLRGYLHALWPAIFLIGVWPLALSIWHPDFLSAWWARECHDILPHTGNLERFGELSNLFGWFTWPMWPVALWSLWFRRKNLVGFGHALPLVSAILALIVITSTSSMRPANVVPLLPAMILMASGELCKLRRGAANAFDWFGLITFTLIGLMLWISWSAMNFGWPEPLSRNVLRLVPGFHPHWNVSELVIAIALSVAWIAAIVKLPFFPLRGAVHWALGVILTWGLTATLWLSWFDYDKNYTPVTTALQTQVLAHGGGCVASVDAGDAQQAAIYYFTGIELQRGPAGNRCNLLLAYSNGKHPLPHISQEWKQIWKMKRGSGRLMEHFGLFSRSSSAVTP